jgi:endonuclease-8
MRMTGSWHIYRRGENWRKPYQQMSVAIEVDDWVAVCFNAPTVETYRVPDKRRHPGMGRLGPDLCKSDTDLSSVVNLLLSYPDESTRLGEVLLDQRVMCGVGNVYRCEVLWARELSPYARVGTLTEHDAIGLVNTAATMLRSNLHHAKRVTALGVRGGLAVYGRNGQRCQRCGETIECRRMGQHNRILYWCPGCQVHLAPQRTATSDDTPMDPHPAAQEYLRGLPWNRDAS